MHKIKIINSKAGKKFFFFISAVKRLIAINRIQINIFVYIMYCMCVYCVYVLCIYKDTHTAYILKILTGIYLCSFINEIYKNIFS